MPAAFRIALRFLVWFAMLNMPSAALCQQTASSRVEISGANEFLPLLNDNLQIVRLTRDASINAEELQRLLAITPQQIKDLLATEGYFSVDVTASLEVNPQQAVAKLQVNTGEPTKISQVDIQFAGALANAPDGPARINRLRRQWLLAPGERFRQAQWDAAKNALLKNLLARDYPAAQIADSTGRS